MTEETAAGTQGADQPVLDHVNLPLAQFHSAEADVLLLKYRHVASLIGAHTHHGSEGTFCENLVREFLRKVLPGRYSVDAGFIRGRPMQVGGETRFVSHQLDIIVHDTTDYSPIFRSEDFVIVLPEAVAAVIEVKKCLTSAELKDSLNKLAVARYLTHHCQPPPLTQPDTGEGCRRVFTAVFAFTSDKLQPATKPFSDTYPNRLAEIGQRIAPMFSVPDMITVMDREILHRGTTDTLDTPFSVQHRLACLNSVNLAGQAFLCWLMVEMRIKEVSGDTWFRYSFPPGSVFNRVMSFETPMDLLPPENAS